MLMRADPLFRGRKCGFIWTENPCVAGSIPALPTQSGNTVTTVVSASFLGKFIFSGAKQFFRGNSKVLYL